MAPPSITVPSAHRWTDEHKVIACVLSRFLKSPGTEDSTSRFARGSDKILGHIFSNDAGSNGAVPALTEPGIRRMVYELHRRGHRSWTDVFESTEFQDRSRWDSEIQLLMAAGNNMNARLVQRHSDHPDARKEIRARKKESRRTAMTRVPAPVAEEPTASQQEQASPILLTTIQYHDILKDWALNDSAWDNLTFEHQLRSKLFFRVVSPMNYSINGPDGDYAGLWTGGRIPSVPRSSIPFMLAAFIHIRPVQEASPFLSLSSNFLWALVMFMRNPDASLQIIDLDRLLEFDKSPSYITPVKRLMEHMPVFNASLAGASGNSTESPSTVRYRPYASSSEWLVWGQIPANAIIASFDNSDLLKFQQSNPDANSKLMLSEIGKCKYTSQATTLLRNSGLKCTGKFGQSVGLFTRAMGLDIVAASKLVNRIKYFWCDKYPNLTPTGRRRRKKLVYGRNLIFLGGVLKGYCQPEQDQAVPPDDMDATADIDNYDEDDLEDAVQDNVDSSDGATDLMELIDFTADTEEETPSSSEDEADLD